MRWVGADDDADCVEHVYGLVQLHPTSAGMQRVKVCGRCGAIAYESGGQAATRPALGFGTGDTT